MKGTDDIVTIGMRGDGDEAMGNGTDTKLLENIIDNQRRIIKEVTKRPAKETPQIWALYKEVQDYYDAGLRVPDDVTVLLCDDNWGNVRRLPTAEEQNRKGGWGLYYHVDYVGAPRNSKWINVTPIQNMWEQLQLIVNVLCIQQQAAFLHLFLQCRIQGVDEPHPRSEEHTSELQSLY